MSMFGTKPHNPPAGVLSSSIENSILPRSRSINLTGNFTKLTRRGRSTGDFTRNGSAKGHEATAIAWLETEPQQAHGWEAPVPGSPQIHIVVSTATSGFPVRQRIQRLGTTALTQKESYCIDIGSEHVVLFSRDGEGLLRGVSTRVQLLSRDKDGDLCIPCGHIDDWPSLPRRIFLDWPRVEKGRKTLLTLPSGTSSIGFSTACGAGHRASA